MVLLFPGPFVTTRGLTRSIKSSADRPKAIELAEVFEQLEADGLGTRRARGNTKAFFKVLPCSVTSLSLEAYGIDSEEYHEKFQIQCNTNYISEANWDAFIGMSPKKEQLAEMYNITLNDPRNLNQAEREEGSNRNENANADANGLKNE